MKKRKDSFIGMHFDFHANDDCTEIGRSTTPEMIQHIIDTVKPDYIQCDCKGHRGYSSYPTKVAYPAPGFVKDNLRIWRDVTLKNDVPLYMHYSGVWDTEAMKHHPDWARVDSNGMQDPNVSSVFGPYVDELLIPQIKELIDEYKIDGVWIDGECWATMHDYSHRAQELFTEQTGIKTIPQNSSDPNYFDYTQFCRMGFKAYLEHYVTQLHDYKADLQIASNWAYTSFMPEKVAIDVDYISGDFTLLDSYNSARVESRCMELQGKPWDLMAWAFCSLFREKGRSTKSVPQLCQEAAGVLSVGGGFQAYFKQKRDGSIMPWEMKLMGAVADFCRLRETWCHKAEGIPQVALFNSTYNFHKLSTDLYAHWHGELNPLTGVLMNLLENQYSVQIVSEHHLVKDIDRYPIIVLPETVHLEENMKYALLDYVEGGGHLLLIGPMAGQLFADEVGVDFIQKMDLSMYNEAVELVMPPEVVPVTMRVGTPEPTGYHIEQWLDYNGWMAGFFSASIEVAVHEGTKCLGMLYEENDTLKNGWPAATISHYGKGKIGAVWLNIGERYVNGADALSRDFLGGLVHELFENPMVKVTGSHYVDVNINRKNGDLLIHLVNTAGPHGNDKIYVFDEIPPIGPLEVTVVLDHAPKKILLQPSGESLQFLYKDHQVKLSLDRLDIYDILQIIL